MWLTYYLFYFNMKASIENLIKSVSSDMNDTVEFKNLIEDHLTFLINHPGNSVINVTAHQIEVYDFDWIGLLMDLQIAPNLFYAIIRMNGGNNLTDVPKELRSLRIPNPSVIQNLETLSLGVKRI